MRRRSAVLYWLLLVIAHFLTDMMGGVLPPVLPEIMRRYQVLLFGAAGLLAISGLASNAGQVFFGRVCDRNPGVRRFLPIMPLVACAPLFLGFAGSYGILAVLVLVGGLSLSLFHPVGVREVQMLPGVPRGAFVSIFLAVGFCGWACGSYVGARIVADLGVRWLCLLGLPAVLVSLGLVLSRRGVEDAQTMITGPDSAVPERTTGYPFAGIWGVGTLIAIASTILISLFPTYLERRLHTVEPGGRANMYFGLFGALGGVLFGFLSHRWRRGYVAAGALATSSVALAVYFLGRSSLCWFGLAGLGLGSAFPLAVAMSHEARGRSSNLRNGLMVGGCWGAASVVLLLVGKADVFIPLQQMLPWMTLLPLLPAIILVLMEANVRVVSNAAGRAL